MDEVKMKMTRRTFTLINTFVPSTDLERLPKRLSGTGQHRNVVSPGAGQRFEKSVSGNVDSERIGADWKNERQCFAEEGWHVETPPGTILIRLHMNLDQTDWAMASVGDGDHPTVGIHSLVANKHDGQTVPVKDAAANGDSDVQDAIPWNGHIPLVSRRTGEFLGWIKPNVSIHICFPLRRTIMRVIRAWFQFRFMR
jgi:hypothetical protein